MKKRISLVLVLCLLLAMTPVYAEQQPQDEVVILYENDVHCAIDGYAKLSAMKKELMATEDYVGVVSVGDYIQGSSIGAISQGEYIVNIMNLVGYDAVTLGNHEFDYKLPRLLELADLMDTKPICSNFYKIGELNPLFKGYDIVSYGDVDVAYIGITTPDTLMSSSPSQFLNENGEYIYTFNGDDLYDAVQKNIDAAESEGADYIVALSHLGTENVFEKWSAQTLVKNTEGIDVVLDGHSHSVIEELTVKDEGGNDVVITSTGTKFENIGKLTITGDGIETELIETEKYTKADPEVMAYIDKINEEYSIIGERLIGKSEVTLEAYDPEGNRIIRDHETNLGDFCADAFRIVTGADVGFMNGGGIRDNIDAGDVTFNDLLNVFPWNNRVVVIETTGQDLVDMLELGVWYFPGENGEFQQVSGITFDLNKDIETPIVFDDFMNFVGVEGQRKVTNVKVLNKTTGEYEPIDLNGTYTLASHNYLLLDQGGGATMFDGDKVISDNGMLDVELLEVYMTEYLDGVIGDEYAESQNRINVISNSDIVEPDEDTSQVPNNDTDEDASRVPNTGDDVVLTMWTALAIASYVAGKKIYKKLN